VETWRHELPLISRRRRGPSLPARSDSEVVIALCLLLFPACRLLLLAIHVHVALTLLGRVGDLGHDLVEEVEAVGLGDGLLEVDGADALGVARFGFGGGFGDEGDHEELERFRCGELDMLESVARAVRTNDDGRDLGDLADIVVGLHDALYAGDGEVVLDGDVVRVGRVCPAYAIARVWHGGH